MPEATLREIMHALGRLQEGLDGIRRDFADEKLYTRQSRQETKERLSKIEETVSIVGQTAAQARDKGTALEQVVVGEIKPSTDEFKRMKALGVTWTTLIGLGGTALGVAVSNPLMQLVATVRGWLS